MQAPPSPIIVRVVEPSDLSGLGDVIIRSIGLTGLITLCALGFGIVFAGVIIGYRKLQARRQSNEEAAQTQPLGLTPTTRK